MRMSGDTLGASAGSLLRARSSFAGAPKGRNGQGILAALATLLRTAQFRIILLIDRVMH